jgi:hypothetical protein
MGASTAPTCECPPGTKCIPCTTGTLQVNVYLQTVCWDTDRTLGLNSPDRPFTGVMVTVWDGGTRVDSKMTDTIGEAIFEGLDAGEVGGSGKDYDFMVSKEGFDDKTGDVQFADPKIQAMTPTTVHIDVHQTTYALRVLRRTGLECTRKHSAPAASGISGTGLGPIFWSHEPWLLVLRDLLWVLSGAAAVIVGFAAFAGAPHGTPFLPGAIACAAICLAYFGYFGGVIFGIAFGIPAILVAFVAFLVIAVLAIISAAAPSFLHLPPPDPWGFPILAGTWVGFGYGWIPQRRSAYNCKGLESLVHPIISAVLGLGTALALCLLLLGPNATDLNDAGRAVAFVLVLIGGALFGGVAGLLGFCFVNEGQTKLNFALSDFLLPFAGQRYCVQGHRGFISHYFRRSREPAQWMDYDEEPSYDWSMPEAARLLCVKEGHIVAFDDSQVGNSRSSPKNTQANYIAVRHFDKTTAKYLHLMTNGIVGPGWNQQLSTAVTVNTVENAFDPTAVAPNPLHVHAGQVLAANGDVGISMFPHLHLYLMKAPPLPAQTTGTGPYDPAPDSHYVGFKFQDGDTQSHGGRCWSMRKYTSSNVDNGLLVIPPDNPPFNPGGTATNGDPVPGSPLATSSSGSSSGSGSTPPTPTPTPPATPPLPGTSSGPPPGTTPPVPTGT